MVKKISNKIAVKTENGLLIPKTDVVFQALFGVKGSESILAGLLSKILGQEVKNVSLDANQNLVREAIDDKLGVLDLRAKIGRGTEVDIEIQLVDRKNLPQRILYYWSRIYAKQLHVKEDYSKLKKTIGILITDYDIPELKDFKDAHTKWRIREERNSNILLFKNLELHIIEMPKIISNPKETEIGLQSWIEFLQNPESEVVKMCKENDENLNNAYEKLEYISGDEVLRRKAELRLKQILDENSMINGAKAEGKAEGRAEGKALGKIEEKKEIAKKLLDLGVEIEKIIEATGLSKSEIQNLK